MTLALLFPGQSAQGAEALRALLPHPATVPVFAALAEAIGLSIDDLLTGPEERLFKNAIAQPLICALELAAVAALAGDADRASVCAGYSIGELAAHGFAGTIDIPDVLRLARLRAEAMDAVTDTPPLMAALRGAVPLPLPDGAHVAIRNGPDRIVIAGRAEAVREACDRAEAAGAAVTMLPVRVASHTPLVAGAAPVFRRALEAVPLRAPNRRVLAGIDGAPVLSRQRAIDTLTRQISETVDWAACMDGLAESGSSAALELPPGTNLSRMLRDRGETARAFEEFRSIDGIRTWLARF